MTLDADAPSGAATSLARLLLERRLPAVVFFRQPCARWPRSMERSVEFEQINSWGNRKKRDDAEQANGVQPSEHL
jgi:hypothetical protein